jgi:RHS repeat-associated protein
MKNSRIAKLIGIGLLVIGLFGSVFGQNLKNTETKADQSLKSNARVNPSTLAMELSIPIGGYSGRAGNGLPINFDYSSKVWEIKAFDGRSWNRPSGTVTTDTRPVFANRSAAGWTSGLGVPRIDYKSQEYEGGRPDITEGRAHSPIEWSDGWNYSSEPFPLYYVKRLSVITADGSSHEFRIDDSINQNGTAPGSITGIEQTGVYLSVDGSKMRLECSSTSTTLFMPDGSRYLFPTSGINYYGSEANTFIDRNGNKMLFDTTTRRWTDNLGRLIDNPMFTNWNTEQYQPVGDKVTTLPSLNGGTTNVTLSWRYLKDPNGGESGLLNTSQALAYKSTAGCFGNQQPALSAPNLFLNTSVTTRLCGGGYEADTPRFNPVVLTKITLANGQSYQFKYNIYGEIEKIFYPTGAYERFQYQANPSIQSNNDGVYDQANRGVSNRWVSAKGDGTDEMHYSYSTSGSVVTSTSPDGITTTQYLYTEPSDDSSPYGFSNPLVGRSLGESVSDANNQIIRSKRFEYEFTGPQSGGFYYAKRDFRQTKEINIIFEPNSTSALATMSETIYDTHTDPQYFAQLNPKQQKSYNYIVLDLNTALYGTNAQISALFTQANLATISEVDYLYSEPYKARNMGGLPVSTKVRDKNGVIVSQNQIVYDDTAILWEGTAANYENPNTNARGNATTTKVWKNDTNTWIETHTQFDQYGNLRKTTDAKGNVSEIEYDTTHHAFAIKTKTPIADPTGVSGSNTAFETTMVYDFNTGLPTSTTDANGLESRIEYDPATLRPHRTRNYYQQNQVGGTSETIYNDTPGNIWVKSRTQIDGTNWAESITYSDGLGRAFKSEKLDSQGSIFTETEFDSVGRPKRSTNPYRANEAKVWTTTNYDSQGRPFEVVTSDGAKVTTAFGLLTTGNAIGTTVTVTDQALKQRRSVTNALGQLTRVDEPNNAGQLDVNGVPAQSTNYVYDTLNNLITVNQGVQTRSFAYDSLSRLKSASNPESGIINYLYDNNSNLLSKTDARNITTNYVYDNLNRVKNRNYSDNVTPNVAYTYDNLPNAKGKLIKVNSSVSTTEYTSFDILGRVLNHKQRTDNNDYTTAYTYNLSGALIEETYPSGRVVRNTLDIDGDLAQVQSRKANDTFKNYANAFTYTSAGAVSSLRLGNGKFENTTFNSRLQPIQIGLGSSASSQNLLKLNFEYGASATENNGNVTKQTITLPTETRNNVTYNGFTATQNYTYDSLNRLKSAVETIPNQIGWKQTFLFDRYGNREFDTQNNNTTTLANGCPLAICNPTANPQDNKLVGTNYDPVGNTSQDANGQTFVYDAENKQVQVSNASGIVGQYWYNGDGQRVKKYVPSTQETTIFVYDASNKLVAEYSTITATQVEAKISYLTNDHLGSPRITTDGNGQVVSRRDFMPFGEEIQRPNYGSDSVRQKFTGYLKDDETELDFAEARMFRSSLGRFQTPDPYNVILEKEKAKTDKEKSEVFIRFVSNTQNWNAYIYVRNNPLSLTDPDGRTPKTINVFIHLSELSKEGLEDWKKLQKSAKENGITVNLNVGTAATAAKFLASLKAENTATIFVGHSFSLDGKKIGIEFHDSSISNKDNAGKIKNLTTADGVDIKNEAVGVFSCSFGKAFDNITSSKGTEFYSINNGSDGKTETDVVNSAAMALAYSLTNGSSGGVVSLHTQIGANMFDDGSGDRVIRRRLGRVGIP